MPPKSKPRGSNKRPKDDSDEEDIKPRKLAKKDSDSEASTSQGYDSSSEVDYNFKIVSWNVNGVKAWLEAGFKGYNLYINSAEQKGYAGTAILSKSEPLDITYGIGKKEHDKEGRVITAEYKQFYLVNTYVPNSGRGLPRQDWDKDFTAYLKKLDKKKPVILCGDLNVAHQEIDLANPGSNKKTAGFTVEERDGFTALLGQGFTDTYRQLYPDKKNVYSFWTYMRNARAKNVGWRLDYFVVSKRFFSKVSDSAIKTRVMGSDHCPISLLLSL